MFLFKKTTPEKTSAKVQDHLLQADCSCEQIGHQDTTRKHYCKALCTLYYLNLSKRNSLDVAFIHTDIIRILKEEKRWDSALQHLMAAKKIYQKHGRDLEAASCCNEIGLIYQITGDVEGALKYYINRWWHVKKIKFRVLWLLPPRTLLLGRSIFNKATTMMLSLSFVAPWKFKNAMILFLLTRIPPMPTLHCAGVVLFRLMLQETQTC